MAITAKITNNKTPSERDYTKLVKDLDGFVYLVDQLDNAILVYAPDNYHEIGEAIEKDSLGEVVDFIGTITLTQE